MDLQLLDKVALVTGSSRGLGFASARALAQEGCRVVLCARDAAALVQAATTLSADAPAPGAVLAVRADVSTPDGAESVVTAAIKKFGQIDVLVNNVGKAAGGEHRSAPDARCERRL